MAEDKRLQREAFMDEIYQRALIDKDIYFLSADFGSGTLEKKFIPELPLQFIHTGIAEQAMMNVATGLALSGRKPYAYAMDCFLVPRAYEQIKVAAANLQQSRVPCNFTVVGVGGGFSYNDAGPTHYTTEVFSCMRAIPGVEIISPADNVAVVAATKESYSSSGLRYIRLDRQNLPSVYHEDDRRFAEDGLAEVVKGDEICLIATGYTTHQALKAQEILQEQHAISAGVVDVYRIAPFNTHKLIEIAENYDKVVTWEEHFLPGGLGSMVAEAFADQGVQIPLKRIGVPLQYYFENDAEGGGRRRIHTLAGIDLESVVEKILMF